MPRKQKKYHYLYKTTNLINNKFYVGMHSTDDLNDGYLGSGKHLRNSVNYYGKQNFKFEILEFFEDRITLKKKEEDFVNLDFIKDPMCMNLKVGGNGFPIGHTYNIGRVLSDATKDKIKNSNKGKHKERLGKTNTQEHIEKVKAALTGKPSKLKGVSIHTDSSKKKISESKKGCKRPDNIWRNKEVFQYDLNNAFIAKFESVKDAMEKTGCHNSKIVDVCKGRRKQTKGFIWRYGQIC